MDKDVFINLLSNNTYRIIARKRESTSEDIIVIREWVSEEEARELLLSEVLRGLGVSRGQGSGDSFWYLQRYKNGVWVYII
jgi:hypothetical protein